MSDLLSDILAHAPAGSVLVTLQANPDVLAVASLAGLRAVIFSSGRTPHDDVVRKVHAAIGYRCSDRRRTALRSWGSCTTWDSRAG